MAIIGAIIGDIAGSQYEFKKPGRINYKDLKMFTNKSKFTDDTVMTLATKHAIQNNIPFADSYRMFGKKYPHAGYGKKFKQWLYKDNAPAYYSFGNGSAMRCSYIGEHFDTEEEIIEWATKSAECTHNHPEGIKGAVVTAMCIYMVRKGALKSELFEYVKREYPKDSYEHSVEYKIREYRETYKWSSSCQDSVPVAIRCFLESDDYESFIRNVYSLNCDTDTLCAIGGGIAEEFYHGTGLDDVHWILMRYLDGDLYQIIRD